MRATDQAGHVDATPASYVWTVAPPPDTTAPDTSILSGPQAQTGATGATLTFSASEAGATFQCALDGAAFNTCVSPLVLTNLSVGVHQLRVRAIDAAGNADATPATYNWRVTPPPETTILLGPALETESTDATFTFEANQAGATFECALDQDLAFEPCASGISYSGLAVGDHEFFVRATGVDGNREPAPATYEWAIGDLTPPVVTITSTPPIATVETTATFTFTADDPAAVFQCSLDGAVFTVCESPKTYTETQLAAASGAVAGVHTFAVHALVPNLLADPIPAEYEWTIEDHTAPETTIDFGPAAEVAYDALEPVVFVFSSNEPGAEFECALDPGVVAPVFSGCAAPPDNSTEQFTGLEPGVHTLLVRAVDSSLNVDATPSSYTWTVIGPPITTISSGPAEGSQTTVTSVTFAFAADQPNVTYMCSLDGAEFAACSSPVSYTAAQLAGPEIDATPYGEHTFEVQATNQYLHVEDPPASRTWEIVDFTVPETFIDSGPSGESFLSSPTFTFSASELDVDYQCKLTGEELFSGCGTPYELSNLPLGTYRLEVFATDAAGNVDTTPAVRTWTVVVPPAPNTQAGTDVKVSFTSPLSSVTFAEVSVPGYTSVAVPASSPALPEGYQSAGARYFEVSTTAEYSAPVTVCLPYNPSDYTLPVRILHHDGSLWSDVTLTTDAATGQACGVADGLSPFAIAAGSALVVPETTIISGPDLSTQMPTATFEFFSTDPNADFECSLDDPLLAYSGCDTPYLIEDLLPGQHVLLVRAKNALGNVDATPAEYRWTVTAPETTITSGPPAQTVQTWAEFGFESNDPLDTFECSLDGAGFSGCETPYLLENLLPGLHELLVRGKNSADTVDPTPASWQWRVLPMPDTAILIRPQDPSTDRNATFTFTSNLQNVTFECALDDAVEGQAFTACTSPVTYTNLVYGEHDFAVRARDAAGNVDLTPAEWGWDIEGPAPNVMISSGPDVTTSSTSATFVFAAEGRNLRYECSFDGGAFSLCAVAEDVQRRPDRPAHLRGAGHGQRRGRRADVDHLAVGRWSRTCRPRRPSSGARTTRATRTIPRPAWPRLRSRSRATSGR